MCLHEMKKITGYWRHFNLLGDWECQFKQPKRFTKSLDGFQPLTAAFNDSWINNNCKIAFN
jgi:hypothetical protein